MTLKDRSHSYFSHNRMVFEQAMLGRPIYSSLTVGTTFPHKIPSIMEKSLVSYFFNALPHPILSLEFSIVSNACQVRQLANDFLRQPIHIQLGDASGGLQANADIVQHLILLRSADEKDDELCKLVNHRVGFLLYQFSLETSNEFRILPEMYTSPSPLHSLRPYRSVRIGESWFLSSSLAKMSVISWRINWIG